MDRRLISWLQENDSRIDWHLFAEPWDAMQLRHNPFRNDQIDTILHASGVLERDDLQILDLGCGPGILGQRIKAQKPTASYYGMDADPLMLSAMQRLVPGENVHPILADLRTFGWALQYQNHFDAVVSLTALHWLSLSHQKQVYTAILKVLKPDGVFLAGDPYLPTDPTDKKRLAAFQQERIQPEIGQTWDKFWQSLFEKYPIGDIYEAYHGSSALFEGSDDGYPIATYTATLLEVGFIRASIYWQAGLRAVYGGTKGP